MSRKIEEMLYPIYNAIYIDGEYIGYEESDFTKEQLETEYEEEQISIDEDGDGYDCAFLTSKKQFIKEKINKIKRFVSKEIGELEKIEDWNWETHSVSSDIYSDGFYALLEILEREGE